MPVTERKESLVTEYVESISIAVAVSSYNYLKGGQPNYYDENNSSYSFFR